MTTTPCRFSICICTRNRPEDLREALRSVARSSCPACEVVVSDDSTDDRSRELVTCEFPAVRLVQGPRTGLGANRNNALAQTTGTHILFIDDDVRLAVDFLQEIAAEIEHLAADADRTIISGAEINQGQRVVAQRISFLGYQMLKYRPQDEHETIVINSTVFPAALFRRLRFDPTLVYGCDEMDVSVRAVLLHRFRILFLPHLANFHYPSPVNRDYYGPFAEASRIYVQFKRFYWVERRPLKAFCFLLLAYLHILLHYLKVRKLAGLSSFRRTLEKSLCYITACLRDRSRYV